jgi:DNA polymerase
LSEPRERRRERLVELYHEASDCTKCPLSETRANVVFGAGNADAGLMFVGEAPGAEEDRQGLPFVGRAGALLTELLNGVGMERRDVWICNVLKCRPPGNRDPQPVEIESCEPYLFRQVELIEPIVVATLGNFATKLLSGRSIGITRVHGQEQETSLGGRRVLLYPLYHPAAALYTPAMLRTLEEDFAQIPVLLASTARSEPAGASVIPFSRPGEAAPPAPEPMPEQLGLF